MVLPININAFVRNSNMIIILGINGKRLDIFRKKRFMYANIFLGL
jgi:hypothetical protein